MTSDGSWVEFTEEFPDAEFTVQTREGKFLLVVKVEVTANGYSAYYEAFYNRSGQESQTERDHSIQRVLYPCIVRWRTNYDRNLLRTTKAQEKAQRNGA